MSEFKRGEDQISFLKEENELLKRSLDKEFKAFNSRKKTLIFVVGFMIVFVGGNWIYKKHLRDKYREVIIEPVKDIEKRH